ncbi:MAG TPA: MmgE/PrpD family protein [Candidatus Bathyarchaeia archaeon]|nr:MmgE/PrpD family protein [Candidatus Bathyarchaeia archaeon]
MTPAARTLAEWAGGLRPRDVPLAVMDNAALRVLDTIGCALAGAREEHVPAVLALASRWSGGGPSTIWGTALTAPPPQAALANGALAHGLDFDDTHADSVCHGSAVLVPTVLALAESERLSGSTVLTALVAGYEGMIRLGMAAPGRFHARGWHATAVCGAFGAALAAGKCLGLDANRLTAALGIAASMASGVMEFLEDGSWVKRIHPGWAAQSGIQAAVLAQQGFTGPATALEGRLGFYRAALGEAPDVATHMKNLGTEWETVRSSFKLYPCCHLSHAYLDAMARLRADHGLRAVQVAEVECLVPAGEVPIICEPVEAKRRPRTPYDAKFSLAFCIAASLHGDRVGIAAFTDESIRNPHLLALADRVRFSIDAASRYPETFPGWVKVRLADGTKLEAREECQRGGAERPIGADEVIAKFRDNASAVLPPARAETLERAVLALGSADDLGSLLRLCRAS